MRKGDGRREGGKKEERNGKIKGWREKWKERQRDREKEADMEKEDKVKSPSPKYAAPSTWS